MKLHTLMLEASKLDMAMEGSKWCHGRPIVNSVSLKVGENVCCEHTTHLEKHGATTMVMAFDKEG